MSTAVESGYRPYVDGQEAGESHSPFLTDRETAEITALTVMGPLALMAFDTKPELGLPPATTPETAQPTPEAPDTIDGFETVELLEAMRQQHNLAAAAIMFADAQYN